MENSRDEFIKNYISLISQVGKDDLDKVVWFCNIFKSDNIELFNKFKNSSQSVDDIIQIYAERYNLDGQLDIEKIMNVFIRNVIDNGVSYHLNSSANRSSILSIGLGTSSIGIKTEERRDYERLEKIASPELFRKLEPFHGDKKGSKVYYSARPILNARYGKMPEWIQELNLNAEFTDFGDENEAKGLVDEILQKYNKKYANRGRDLFILPYLGKKISSEELKKSFNSPQMAIEFVYNMLLNLNDEFYTGCIPGNEITSIDLENMDLHFLDRDGKIQTIDPFQRGRISCKDMVKNAIQSGVTLDDINKYDMQLNEKQTKEKQDIR